MFARVGWGAVDAMETARDGVDVASYAPIQEMPVQSAILSPLPNAPVATTGEELTVSGFAWSGGES